MTNSLNQKENKNQKPINMKKKNKLLRQYLDLLIFITMILILMATTITPILISMVLVMGLNKSPYLFLINLIYIPLLPLFIIAWNNIAEE